MAMRRDLAPPTLPPLGIESSEKTDHGAAKPEVRSAAPGPASRLTHWGNPGFRTVSSHRFLTQAEWARVAHALGAIRDGESHTVCHPTDFYWPPKGMPEGLYRDVVYQRIKNHYSYHVLSILRWHLMIVQIIIGACLTALAATGLRSDTPVTVLAAISTIDAGILALMHNSGLPDRYRMNKVEFSAVEDYIKELIETGIVESHETVDEIVAGCFDKFKAAKATVLSNMPDHYASSTVLGTVRNTAAAGHAASAVANHRPASTHGPSGPPVSTQVRHPSSAYATHAPSPVPAPAAAVSSSGSLGHSDTAAEAHVMSRKPEF